VRGWLSPAVTVFVEADGAAELPVEDERAVRPTPGLLALDDGHQFRRVLGVHGNLDLALRLIEFRPEGQCLVDW